MARKKSATNRSIASNGYVILWKPEHPQADKRGYIYEHRVIAEQILGRNLSHTEVVHHKDGNKTNNSPDNLEIFPSASYHRAKHRKNISKLRLPGENNPIVFCKCGCGKTFEKYDKHGRPRLFIFGHNGRI